MPEKWKDLDVMMSCRSSIGTSRSLKNQLQVVAVGFFLIAGLTLVQSSEPRSNRVIESSEGCQIPAIYNFGDSNSDTGGVSSAFGRIPYPSGISFFDKPSGRYCDGRLLIDFIAEKLGFPYLNPYLDALQANFQHGADFAASGTTIQHVDVKLYGRGFNPLSLDVQLLQFEELQERTGELYGQDNLKDRLSKPEDFSKALYTFDIGQNDIQYVLQTMTQEEGFKLIPELINQLALSIEKLHQLGARTFWIHNTGPIGCLPLFLRKNPPKPDNVDEAGCIKSFNDMAKEFNRQLKDRISELRTQLHDSLLFYVDIYAAKYSLISQSEKYGFVNRFDNCCKHTGNSRLYCWMKQTVNGTAVYATPCRNPLEYLSWDSIHYTEAANRLVASWILDGSFSDPPLPLTSLCTKSSL